METRVRPLDVHQSGFIVTSKTDTGRQTLAQTGTGRQGRGKRRRRVAGRWNESRVTADGFGERWGGLLETGDWRRETGPWGVDVRCHW